MIAKKSKTGFFIEPFSKSYDRSKFSCGIEDLDRYFQDQVGQDIRRNVSACFLLFDEETEAIAGFYTLSMKSVLLADLPEDTKRKLPRYPEVPAVLLGRMGIDDRYQGKGLGGILLYDALERAYNSSQEIGAYAVIVDAKHGAEQFYLKYGFIPFPDEQSRLFLPIKTIKELL